MPLGALVAGPGGIPLGLADLPDEQRIATATWHPERDGHLLLLGAAGSGKSTALETIAVGAATASGSAGAIVEWIPAAADAAWDAVARLEGASAAERLVILDDIDSVLSRFSPDHRVVFVERLGRVLRDGPSRGIRVVLAAQRLTADTQSLASLAPSRLLLGQASRQDHVLAGGEGAHYVDGLAPGAGHWRGARMQFASGAARRPPDPSAIVDEPRGRPLAIVSSRVGLLATRLAPATRLADLGPDITAIVTGSDAPIVLGDVDEWQSRWGAIAALRPLADILFEGCTIADFRALTRSRDLPPPLDPADPTLCWLLNDDGSASRARLPSTAAPAIPRDKPPLGN
jgi:S-DNA-T family DNA segregation ATPase FtsK/SpoIIIE